MVGLLITSTPVQVPDDKIPTFSLSEMEVADNRPQGPPPERVQALVDAGVSTIPTRYVQPEYSRSSSPFSSSPASTVPIINCHHFHSNHAAHLRDQISLACSNWGAFQVVNHGIPIRLLDDVRRVGLGFFGNTPAEVRMQYSCEGTGTASEGYGSRMLAKDDGVLDWRDYFDHHTLPLSRRNPLNWPASPEDYREIVSEYSDNMKNLAQKLLNIVSESLGLKSTYIEEAVGDVHQNITISYYPPCPQPDLALGLQSHSDMGAITLLIQDDVGGLEVLKGGEWVLVQPLSDAVVVILADQTEIITNGRYKSAVHRAVVNSHRARLSVATFYDPPKVAKICPAPELISESIPSKYRGVIYGDYVSSWYGSGPEGKRNIDALLLQQ